MAKSDPKKSVMTTLRLPEDLMASLKTISYLQDRPKNQIIVEILAKQVPKMLDKETKRTDKPLIL